MARYTGPNNKRARRVSFSILENGKELAKRPYAPGAHGNDKRRKASEYGVQLAEKQKIRLVYGLNEKQFHKLYDRAAKMEGKAGFNLLCLLESRLDNVVYRMGMAATRRAARQLVNHGHILVDGNKVDIPSYRLKPGQVVSLKEKDKDMVVVKEALEKVVSRVEFVTFDENKLSFEITRYWDEIQKKDGKKFMIKE